MQHKQQHSISLNEQWHAIAEETLPGAGLGGYALAADVRFVFKRGKGAYLWDVDGREYVDYVGGAGALILGHSHPAIVNAVHERVADGMHVFGTLNDAAIALSQRLVNDIPCAEKIAYATTGSEATAYAMRLARAHTGREKILKFAGAYHGNHDYALVSTFPTNDNYPLGTADTAGQPQSVARAMLVAPYNDLATTTAIADAHAEDLAAIIVEPVQRIIRGEPEFLAGLRNLCDRLGAVLIFDEVVTGFRLAYGGAQATLGITPDLATFGKIIGAGGPLAVVAGKADIINLADPAKKGEPDYAYFNGTLHGNPAAAAATLAMLDELSVDGFYDRLNNATEEFCQHAQHILNKHKVPALACHVDSLWQFLFMPKVPRQHADIAASDTAAMRRLDSALLRRGQYVLPGVRRFLSAAHDEQAREKTLAALADCCKEF